MKPDKNKDNISDETQHHLQQFQSNNRARRRTLRVFIKKFYWSILSKEADRSREICRSLAVSFSAIKAKRNVLIDIGDIK